MPGGGMPYGGKYIGGAPAAAQQQQHTSSGRQHGVRVPKKRQQHLQAYGEAAHAGQSAGTRS